MARRKRRRNPRRLTPAEEGEIGGRREAEQQLYEELTEKSNFVSIAFDALEFMSHAQVARVSKRWLKGQLRLLRKKVRHHHHRGRGE